MKYSRINQYLFNLNKITSLNNNEVNQININHTIGSFFILFVDTVLNDTKINKYIQTYFHSNSEYSQKCKNKSCDKNPNINQKLNFHNVCMIFFISGIAYLTKSNPCGSSNNILYNIKNLDTVKKIKKVILKEKCNNCIICNNINELVQTLNLKSEKSYLSHYNANSNTFLSHNSNSNLSGGDELCQSEALPKKISLQTNNFSSNHILKDKRKTNFICSFQSYMLNTRKSMKYKDKQIKLITNNNNINNNNTCTYNEVKTTTTSNSKTLTNQMNTNSNISSHYSHHYSLPKPEGSNTKNRITSLEKSLSLISQNIDSIQNDFTRFKNFNVKIKNEIKSINFYSMEDKVKKK